MTDHLPPPLVPAEVDLNGYGFMPMLHHRVLQSTLFVKSNGDEFKAAFALWCASWSEVPAGSLPNDEEMLEHLSRSKTWKKVRARAMHGWVLCSDDRFYHPTLAPLAIDAWSRREEFREVLENKETRQDRWRKRCKELSDQLRALGITPPKGAGLEKLETLLRDAQASTPPSRRDALKASQPVSGEMPLTGTETVTETETVDTHSATPTEGGRVSRLMRSKGIPDGNPGHPDLLALIAAGATDAEFEGAAISAVAKGKGFAYAIGTLKRQRQEAAQLALHRGAMPPPQQPNSAHDRRIATLNALTGKDRHHATAPAAPADVVDVDARTVDG